MPAKVDPILVLDRRAKNSRTVTYKEFTAVLKMAETVTDCSKRLNVSPRTLKDLAYRLTNETRALYEQLKARGNLRKGPHKKQIRSRKVSEVGIKLLATSKAPAKIFNRVLACRSKKDFDDLIDSRLPK